MKAPEKIYLYPSDRAGEEYEDEWGDRPWGEDYVEYTHTDAFINKACELLKSTMYNDDVWGIIISGKFHTVEEFIRYFKKAMKGGEG